LLPSTRSYQTKKKKNRTAAACRVRIRQRSWCLEIISPQKKKKKRPSWSPQEQQSRYIVVPSNAKSCRPCNQRDETAFNHPSSQIPLLHQGKHKRACGQRECSIKKKKHAKSGERQVARSYPQNGRSIISWRFRGEKTLCSRPDTSAPVAPGPTGMSGHSGADGHRSDPNCLTYSTLDSKKNRVCH
jgi:hypothetical protein